MNCQHLFFSNDAIIVISDEFDGRRAVHLHRGVGRPSSRKFTWVDDILHGCMLECRSCTMVRLHVSGLTRCFLRCLCCRCLATRHNSQLRHLCYGETLSPRGAVRRVSQANGSHHACLNRMENAASVVLVREGWLQKSSYLSLTVRLSCMYTSACPTNEFPGRVTRCA